MSKFSDFNFSGHKALIRVDFNVPIDMDFNVTDNTRITATIPTIKKILEDGKILNLQVNQNIDNDSMV